MEKLDLTKQYKSYYTAARKPELVSIPPAQYIAICGKGDPSSTAFAAPIEALYATAYTIKFAYKARGKDFTVPRLEGLWWYDEKKYPGATISSAATAIPRSEWEYRLLIRLPDFVQQSAVADATAVVLQKNKAALAARVTYFTMEEGSCVQMLHVGPFANEPESLQQMADYMQTHQLGRNGMHHEIYLSDFRKTAPEKLKTILREPVRKG